MIHYDTHTDDEYDDDSDDVTILNLTDICEKSSASDEENVNYSVYFRENNSP